LVSIEEVELLEEYSAADSYDLDSEDSNAEDYYTHDYPEEDGYGDGSRSNHACNEDDYYNSE